MSDSYLATLERLADGCSSGGHLLCAHTLECRLALDEMVAAKNSREMAAKFDAGRERLSLQFEQPSETWSTSALLRTARTTPAHTTDVRSVVEINLNHNLVGTAR